MSHTASNRNELKRHQPRARLPSRAIASSERNGVTRLYVTGFHACTHRRKSERGETASAISHTSFKSNTGLESERRETRRQQIGRASCRERASTKRNDVKRNDKRTG